MISGLYKIEEAGQLGYLMSCYTKHPDGLDAAAEEVTLWTAKLMAAGVFVYAPITYGHAVSAQLKNTDMPEAERYSHELWMSHCERMWNKCDYGLVLMNKGWGLSEGIALEISEMIMAEKTVYFLDIERSKVLRLGELIDEADDAEDHPLKDYINTSTNLAKAKHIANYDANAVNILRSKVATAFYDRQVEEAAPASPSGWKPVRNLIGKVLQ